MNKPQTNAPRFAPVITEADKAPAITAVTTTATNEADMPQRAKTEAPAMAGEFQMFTNIPVPEARASRESKYGWDVLEVGASFFVPGAKPDTFNTLTSTRNKNEIKKNGEKAKKFVARKFTHEGVVGVMVWRTA